MPTIIVVDCDSGYIRWHCHTIAKSSSISWANGQADSEHFGILWDSIIHNGHIEGALTHTITEWTQKEVSAGIIVTGSYRWMKGLCVLCVCMCIMLHISSVVGSWVSEKCMGTQSNSRLCDKPAAVADPSTVLTSKKNDVSIGSAPGGTEMATVSVATPSLSKTVTFVSTKPTVIPAERNSAFIVKMMCFK